VLCAKVDLLVELYIKNRQLLEQEQHLVAMNRALQIEINEHKASDEKAQQINQQLHENLVHLEIANNDLSRFAYMASHDLQEPLRKIRMFSSSLNLKYKDILQDDSKIVSRIDRAAERMQLLIDSILALTKVSSEKTRFERCNVNALLAEIRADLKEEMKEKNVELQADDIPYLFANPELIRQLFQNLINNAIKYRKKDSPALIKIYAEKNANENSQDCVIYVEDNGIGFDPKYSEEIFGMLRKLNGNQYEGTGIGLTLCRKITDIHHGSISARSNLGEGSTFIVSLPRYRDVL